MKPVEEKIDVPDYVLEALEEVRQGGKYNMFESQNVFNEMYFLGHYKAVSWLLDENWREGSFKSQAHNARYGAALHELGEVNGLIYKLAGKE